MSGTKLSTGLHFTLTKAMSLSTNHPYFSEEKTESLSAEVTSHSWKVLEQSEQAPTAAPYHLEGRSACLVFSPLSLTSYISPLAPLTVEVTTTTSPDPAGPGTPQLPLRWRSHLKLPSASCMSSPGVCSLRAPAVRGRAGRREWGWPRSTPTAWLPHG